VSPKRTRREEIVVLLEEGERGFDDLRRQLEIPVHVLEEDLRHIDLSVRAAGKRLVIGPALCLACGFIFTKSKFHPPGRCPKCRDRRISGPAFSIAPTGMSISYSGY
jgi:predicted Zn-ribbon and HTH transcriptional regulator